MKKMILVTIGAVIGGGYVIYKTAKMVVRGDLILPGKKDKEVDV